MTRVSWWSRPPPQHPTVSAGVAVFEPEDAAETAETLLARVRVIVPEVVGFTMQGVGGAGIFGWPGHPGVGYLGGDTLAVGVISVHPAAARHHFTARIDNWIRSRSEWKGELLDLENNPQVGQDIDYLVGQAPQEKGADQIEVERRDLPGIVEAIDWWDGVAARGEVVTFDFQANAYLQWSVNGELWNTVSKIPWFVKAISDHEGVRGGVAHPEKDVTISGDASTEVPQAPDVPIPGEGG